MHKNFKISAKQLVFLEDFLQRKYKGISKETKAELINYLRLDFEATTKNGNLSQYLSNEINFIKNYVDTRTLDIKKNYSKETWLYFYGFLTNFKLMPIAIITMVMFYYLNESFNSKIACLVLFGLHTILFIVSLNVRFVRNKLLRKLYEVQFLGIEIWLPFLLVHLLSESHVGAFITSNSFIFSTYASFVILYGFAALFILKENKKRILNTYKHLLN